MFPHPPSWRVDVDFHIIISEALSENEIEAIKSLHEVLKAESSLGEELDGYYLALEDAKKGENPRHQIWTNAVDNAWALHRAHVHAGKFELLYGEDPRHFLPTATWEDCRPALASELQFIKDHPEYPQFGMLNLARLLYSWRTKDVVTSKYESAQWALEKLDTKWHPAITAALRDYEERMQPGDSQLLAEVFPDFLEYCQAEIDRQKT